MALRHKTNRELFTLYDNELILRIHNTRNLNNDRRLLSKFCEYLGNYPPSPELAKGFLAQYVNHKPTTFARYSATIKAFMKWYGQPIEDLRVRIPRTLPPYTEDSDIEKLLKAIENKKTHKSCILRDSLLIAVADKTGVRRGELAKLEVRDVHSNFLVVRSGKGGNDRIIPLTPDIAQRLQDFIKDMKPTEKVFKLKAPSIGNKIRLFAKRAGLDNLHCHSLRHKYATDLLEAGADIKAVQELLGHTDLGSTQIYLSITNKRLHEAVKLLDERKKSVDTELTTYVSIPITQTRKLSKRELEKSKRLAEKLWPELSNHGRKYIESAVVEGS